VKKEGPEEAICLVPQCGQKSGSFDFCGGHFGKFLKSYQKQEIIDIIPLDLAKKIRAIKMTKELKVCAYTKCINTVSADRIFCTLHYNKDLPEQYIVSSAKDAYKKQAIFLDSSQSTTNIVVESGKNQPPISSLQKFMKKSSKKKEGVVMSNGNNESVYRQNEYGGMAPLVPIYYSQDGEMRRAGVAFLGKYKTDTSARWFTAYHVVKSYGPDGPETGFVKINGEYKKFTWKHEYGDLASMEGKNMVFKGMKPYTVATEEETIKLGDTFDGTMYTINVTDDVQMCAKVYGIVDHHEVLTHGSDTFDGQCGSPYISSGKVYFIHGYFDQENRVNGALAMWSKTDF